MVLNHFQQCLQTVLKDNTVNADMLSLFQMLTLIVLRALCVYCTGHLEQPQISSTKKLSRTARLECMVSGVTISTTSVYWYQERPG